MVGDWLVEVWSVTCCNYQLMWLKDMNLVDCWIYCYEIFCYISYTSYRRLCYVIKLYTHQVWFQASHWSVVCLGSSRRAMVKVTRPWSNTLRAWRALMPGSTFNELHGRLGFSWSLLMFFYSLRFDWSFHKFKVCFFFQWGTTMFTVLLLLLLLLYYFN